MVAKKIGEKSVTLIGRYESQLDQAYMAREEAQVMKKLTDDFEKQGHDLYHDEGQVKCYNCDFCITRHTQVKDGESTVVIEVVGNESGSECKAHSSYTHNKMW